MTEVTDRFEEARPRRFRPYLEYSESGVDWLGKMPAHWEARRLRFVVETSITKKEVRDLDPETEVSFVPMEAVREYGGIDLNSTKALSEVVEGYTYFRNGDVIVAKITPCFENGKGALASDLCSDIGFGTTELHVLRPSFHVDPRFLLYLTFSDHFRSTGTASMYGAGGQKRISDDFIRDFRHPIPSLREQCAIADFLDRETARIDALVARKERLIELLQEKRTGLITRAVTRGLDPNVPMKDSGVEWLGDIPAHWRVGKLKHACERIFVGIAEAATFAYVDEGVPMLRSTDVRANRVRTEDIRCIDIAFADRLASKQLRTDDIMTVRTGNAGVSAVVPPAYDGGQCFTLVVSRPTTVNDSRYFCYWLNARPGQEQFRVEGLGTAQVNISVPIVQNAVVCIPPREEQVQIANWIEQEVTRWNRLMDRISRAIDHLREFRTALISAAVTGKIDVREAMPR